MNRVFHVAVNGKDTSEGTERKPFRTIGKAAEIAETGDTVIVHEGEYREWVSPAHGGYSDVSRITYEAAAGEHVIIKGSERITDWQQFHGTVWKCELPNQMFGDYNPYKEEVSGDWVVYPLDGTVHTGDVYLNGKSFYEAASLQEVEKAEIRRDGYNAPWTRTRGAIPHPEDTRFQWFAEVGEETTTIYANFQGADPNQETTEINVRKCCFYPERTGLDYITVRGFEMAQAASPWAPPTADQPGLLGTHWSKGWIIENNIIHDAKCSAISVGKEISTGHNLCTRRHQKPGYQYQMEAVFRALQIGWSKEKIGSHIIRNNTIYDCGQNAIVGHMGGAFSRIYHNHIYNIAMKHEFFGYEIAGIKLHAAIDVQITDNCIHDCTLGTWLDWEAQGTRVSQNLYYQNERDLMIEVTHGPCLVDNNIFASGYNFDNAAQGTAYINNLCAGYMRKITVLDRATPYHFPHSTQPAGVALVYSGDDRLYQNIFVGGGAISAEDAFYGTEGYNGAPGSYEEYQADISAAGPGDHEVFNVVKQPVYIEHNCYMLGAEGFEKEQDKAVTDADPKISVLTRPDGMYLEIYAPEELFKLKTEIMNTEKLGMVRIVDAPYDSPSGEEITLDLDYLGQKRGNRPVAGPVENLQEGYNLIKVWDK